MLYSSLSSGFPSVLPQTNQVVDKTPPIETLYQSFRLREEEETSCNNGVDDDKYDIAWSAPRWPGERLAPNLQGLSKRTTSEGLHAAFAKFGEVVRARVVTDRGSGYSKGFGFVKYATLDEAAAGIKGMDGQVS